MRRDSLSILKACSYIFYQKCFFGSHVTWNSAVPDPNVWCCILLILCTLDGYYSPFEKKKKACSLRCNEADLTRMWIVLQEARKRFRYCAWGSLGERERDTEREREREREWDGSDVTLVALTLPTNFAPFLAKTLKLAMNFAPFLAKFPP